MSEPFSPLSEGEIRRGLWYLEHRKTLRRIFLFVLATADLLLVLFVLWGGVREFQTRESRRAMERAAVRPPEVRAVDAALPLQVLGLTTIPHARSTDLIAELENTNEEFTATIAYAFTGNGQILASGTETISPRSRAHVAAFSPTAVEASNIQFETRAVSWRRTNAHAHGRYREWKDRVGDLRVTDVRRFSRPQGLGVSFVLRNESAFHLREVSLVILLYRAEKIVGSNTFLVENLASASERDVELVWNESETAITSVSVEPHLNWLDEQNRYIPSE